LIAIVDTLPRDSYEISKRESELTGSNKQLKMYDISERELGTAVTSKESEYPSKAGTDCIGSNKSNYHTITTTTAPQSYSILRFL
jgi:hypothetical protein